MALTLGGFEMARAMGRSERLFRAVLKFTYESGRTYTRYEGPFTAKAPATVAVNREKAAHQRAEQSGWDWQGPYTIETRIEFHDPQWEVLP